MSAAPARRRFRGLAATAVHAADGIDIRCGVLVEALGVDGVTVNGGELVPADVIVVGIGVAPATGWLDGSGLTLRDGIVCDDTLAAAPGRVGGGRCVPLAEPPLR